jgi:hypothetical protein
MQPRHQQTVASQPHAELMNRNESRGAAAIRSRHTVDGDFTLAAAIDELRKEIGPGNDASRWNPFVATTIAGSDVVAVVAPGRVSGTVRLAGRITGSPLQPAQPAQPSEFAFEAVRGPRGRGLRITHEIELARAGSFLTRLHFHTTVRGPAAVLVSRRRIADWHCLEIDALRSRIRRHHRDGQVRAPNGEENAASRPLERV